MLVLVTNLARKRDREIKRQRDRETDTDRETYRNIEKVIVTITHIER